LLTAFELGGCHQSEWLLREMTQQRLRRMVFAATVLANVDDQDPRPIRRDELEHLTDSLVEIRDGVETIEYRDEVHVRDIGLDDAVLEERVLQLNRLEDRGRDRRKVDLGHRRAHRRWRTVLELMVDRIPLNRHLATRAARRRHRQSIR